MRDTGPPWTDPDEKATLLGFLDYLRESIARKAAGVPEPQVRTPGVPSGTNLLGLIKHLTHVERFYFLGRPITTLSRTLKPTRTETLDQWLTDYREATQEANKVIDTYTDLSQPAPHPGGRGVAPRCAGP